MSSVREPAPEPSSAYIQTSDSGSLSRIDRAEEICKPRHQPDENDDGDCNLGHRRIWLDSTDGLGSLDIFEGDGTYRQLVEGR